MYYYDYYCTELANEARRDKVIDRRVSRSDRPMTEKEWYFNNSGSADPRNVSVDAIFSAYRDYRMSQQWN